MLTCFNLEPPATVEEFSSKLIEFSAHMRGPGLIETTGPIGRRQRHPIMDTDDERDHEYFFIMSFADREQCDKAVEQMQSKKEPGNSIHTAVYSSICDAVFICWEDI